MACNIMKKRIQVYLKALLSIFRKMSGRSNTSKWSRKENLHQDWDERTKLLAGFVVSGESVIEFGAARLSLREFMPADCQYMPSDIVDRGGGTFVCDLNKLLPAFPKHDVAFFSGVLEYVNDVPRLIERLAKDVKVIVASYCITDTSSGLVGRRAIGWVNDYSDSELVALFARQGFVCRQTGMYQKQKLYRFERQVSTDGVCI